MKHLRQDHGYSLLLTIFVIVLISVIGLGLLTVNVQSLKISKNEAVDQSVYYIAEAGLNLEKAKLIGELNIINSDLFDDFEKAIEDNEKLPIGNRETLDFFIEKFKSSFINQSYILICGHFNDSICKSPTNKHQQFNQQFNQKPFSDTQVTVACDEKECRYTIISHGFSPSKKRSLSQELKIDLEKILTSSLLDFPIPNLAAVTSGNITLEGGAMIYGNVASGGIVSLSGGTGIPGSLAINPGNLSHPNWFPAQSLPTIIDPIDLELEKYLPKFPEINFNNVTNLVAPNTEVVNSPYNKTEIIKNGHFMATNWMTDGYELNLNTDTYFKSFNVSQNNTITLNTGNKEINLYVDKLDIAQGKIKITGTGKLNIIVKDSVNIKGSFNDNGDTDQASIYYQGATSVTFSNETSLYGSFYTNTADLTLTGGASLKGNIYSGGNNITISGGVPTTGQYIIAPNAELKLLQGGKITGTVVVKSIYANGGTSINYGTISTPEVNKIFITELPITEI